MTFILHSRTFILFNLRPIGRHCCLWCTIDSASMQRNPADREPYAIRTLDSLSSDYDQLVAQESGSKAKAKKFNNVIGKPFFNIPLDQVYNISLACV